MSDIQLVYAVMAVCVGGVLWIMLCIAASFDKLSEECNRLSREITRINKYNSVQYERRYEMEQVLKDLKEVIIEDA